MRSRSVTQCNYVLHGDLLYLVTSFHQLHYFRFEEVYNGQQILQR